MVGHRGFYLSCHNKKRKITCQNLNDLLKVVTESTHTHIGCVLMYYGYNLK